MTYHLCLCDDSSVSPLLVPVYCPKKWQRLITDYFPRVDNKDNDIYITVTWIQIRITRVMVDRMLTTVMTHTSTKTTIMRITLTYDTDNNDE